MNDDPANPQSTGPRIHAELQRQIDARTTGIQAVVHFRVRSSENERVDPSACRRTAEDLLARASQRSGRSAVRVNVLANLRTLIVQADAEFLQILLSEPEIVSAMPNQPGESPFITPK